MATICEVKSNQIIIEAGNGDKVLVSYKTPVAALINGKYIKTNKYHSNTTSKHINHFVGLPPTPTAPQEFFDRLLIIRINTNFLEDNLLEDNLYIIDPVLKAIIG